eukprot:m.25606 g.25606  ORF g.25606 m.25606 type:complete len:628 (+) comp11534_c0_seq1:137-2020(+)
MPSFGRKKKTSKSSLEPESVDSYVAPAPPARPSQSRGRGRGNGAPSPVGQQQPATYDGGSYSAGAFGGPEYAAPEEEPKVPPRSSASSMGAPSRPETKEAKVQMATPGHEFEKWQLGRGSIEKLDKQKAFAYGAIFRGKYVDPVGAVVPVTLKDLHTAAAQDDADLEPRRLFIFEASILMELQHPNIARLFGVCSRTTPWLMVTEYLEYGDLRTVLEQLNKSKIPLTLAEHIHLAQNVGAGMLYLASKQFIHRDMRCRNCAVSLGDNGETAVKIVDFGMSSLLVNADDYSIGDNPVDHGIRWMAPESMRSLRFTLRSDVWSFGMVLYEIFTYGGVPFQGIPESGLRAHVLGKHTPKVPKSCTSKIVGRLMEATWALDAKRRPDAFEITTKLADAQVTALSDNKQTVRNIGKLAAGSVVSPYAALDTGHAQYATSADMAASAYAGLSGGHATYSTTPAGLAERELYGHVISVGEDGTTYARRPKNGPGSGIGGVAVASSTYEALEADRAIYSSTNGLGSSYKVPGLDPNALYYHGVCSRPIAERALFSQGPVESLNGTFLVRQSPRGQGSMVVSMVFDGVVWHYKMNKTAKGYEYYGNNFKDIDAIIDHHKKRPEAMLCCLNNHCSRY